MNIFCKIINDAPKEEISSDDIKQYKNDSNISEVDLKKMCFVEYKSQAYASFYNTAMEKDKSILTLSVAGIGFLVTLLNLSKTIGYVNYTIFILAALCFLISIYCILSIFDKNADYMLDIAQDRDVTLKEYKLKKLDKRAIRTFYLAIILSISLGISTSIPLLSNEGNDMSENNKPTKASELNVSPESYSGSVMAVESFEGISYLGKSLSGFSGASSLLAQTNTQVRTQGTTPSNTGGASGMKPDFSSQKKD
ncbi:hypothetical protein [Aeromonas dhakensis]|uniref:hypothetical protein n=1 Tax=Aeromonas dhakensis TaxID=196024 RepID=UPI003D1952F0